MTATATDQAKQQAFGAHILGVLNGAFTALAVSIGHRTGLFDALATLPPATSDAIAAATGLHERYVREWLAAMVVGGVIEYDATARTYHLPAEHAAFLTRAAGPRNLGPRLGLVGLLGSVEEQVAACFEQGGGVPYSQYGAFTRLMADLSGDRFQALLIDRMLPLVPGLVAQLRAGAEVLDVACGAGRALLLMAAAFPASRFTGCGFSTEAIAEARARAAAEGLTNVTFIEADAARFDAPARYDAITAFDAIHDQAEPAMVLATIAAALKPGGHLLMADFAASSDLAGNRDRPLAPFAYTMSLMHCMTVSLALGGAGLGAMWGEERARDMLAAAGLTVLGVHRIEGDLVNNYFVCRK